MGVGPLCKSKFLILPVLEFPVKRIQNSMQNWRQLVVLMCKLLLCVTLNWDKLNVSNWVVVLLFPEVNIQKQAQPPSECRALY